MDDSLELYNLLCDIVGITEPDGDRHVYDNPPETVKIKYPAIIYSRTDFNNLHANNSVYAQFKAYEVKVIDEDPDSIIVRKVSLLPQCKWNRHYKSDNLNHEVFTLYH